MDIPTADLPLAHKPYPILLKYQMFMDEEIRLLENDYRTQKAKPFKCSKTAASLSFRLLGHLIRKLIQHTMAIK